ncbi:MAG: hypothetical protein J1F42_00760 [Lachnospiraceae bacterium]|nr:hypothetical protein [Lachnospiraceae bacterium]
MGKKDNNDEKYTLSQAVKKWAEENVFKGNIFQGKLVDGSLYFVLYMVIPIIITSVSLIALENVNFINIASCYLTIFISSLGCIYDAINRWEDGDSIECNRKLIVMVVFLACVTIYCLVVIFGVLFAQKDLRNDFFLLAYVCSNVIAMMDLINCINLKLAKQDTV